MSWHRVLREDRLATDGAPALVEVRGKSIGLYRSGAAVRAVLDYCPHKGAPICRGRIESFAPITTPGEPLRVDGSRKVLRCPWHHWEFFLDTGRAVLPSSNGSSSTRRRSATAGSTWTYSATSGPPGAAEARNSATWRPRRQGDPMLNHSGRGSSGSAARRGNPRSGSVAV